MERRQRGGPSGAGFVRGATHPQAGQAGGARPLPFATAAAPRWHGDGLARQRPEVAPSVAVKQLVLTSVAADEERLEARARLRYQVRLTARVDHPGTVQIYDLVEEGGEPWIVMEALGGRTLEATLRDHGPNQRAQATRLGLVIEGLLAKDPAQRLDTGQARRALRALRGGRSSWEPWLGPPMRRGFAMPCITSRTHTSAQVKGTVEGCVVGPGRGYAWRSFWQISGKGLDSRPWRGRRRERPGPCSQLTGT